MKHIKFRKLAAMNLQQQKGFTLFELLFVIFGLACIALTSSMIYVIIHFLSKFW